MEAQKRFKVPATAIALDLAGCLLIVLGALNLSGFELSFFPSIPAGGKHGWTLVVFGVVFVIAATMLIIGVMLAHREPRDRSSPSGRRVQ